MVTSIGQYTPVFLPGDLPPWQRSLAGHSLQGCKESDKTKWPYAHSHKTFFACSSSTSIRVKREGGSAAWLLGILEVLSVKGHALPPLQKLWPSQSLFWASCSWQSQALCGQSFSIALPVQALRRLPCLRPFCVVQCIRYIEGPPWLGSYSIDQRVRQFNRHPGRGPTLSFGASVT